MNTHTLNHCMEKSIYPLFRSRLGSYFFYTKETDTMKVIIAAAAFALAATQVAARDNVHVTGSSTVLPYATIVAEAFGENFDFPTPVVEGGGSGAGRKKLCEGIGPNTVDIANSSSKMKEEELHATLVM